MGFITILSCLVAGLAAGAPEADSLERYQATQVHMGVPFTIVLYAPNEPAANRAFQAAFDRIEELDGILSDFDPESELSRLSRASPTPDPVRISDDLSNVLLTSLRCSERTDGAFDVTVGPLTQLWRRARRRQELPSQARLDQALSATGFDLLQLDPTDNTAMLTRPNMRLDLGGIAKGYAIDEALDQLAELGISRALVNGGGDIGASDPPPDETGWLVGLASLEPEGEPTAFVRLAHQAVATSGDAFQFVEIDGLRYSHIVDPRTGKGLTERSSVSVLTTRCTIADCLASAVSVMGPEAGRELIEEMCDTHVIIVTVDENEQASTTGSEDFPEVEAPGS